VLGGVYSGKKMLTNALISHEPTKNYCLSFGIAFCATYCFLIFFGF